MNPRPGMPNGAGQPSQPGRGPMAPGGMGGGGVNPFDQMRGYLELVDRFARLSRDATTSGVAAVITANDVLRARGPQVAIDFFTKALPTVKNPAIERAIRLQLIDLYKASGQADKALEQLQTLMSAPAAAGNDQQQSAPPPPRP